MKTAISIVLALLVVGGLYFFFAKRTQAPVQNPETVETGTSAPVESTNPNANAGAEADQGIAQPAVVVTYTNSGFSPKSVDVAPGTTVTFVNQSSHGMWVASDVHPTHTAYDGTTLKEHCATGGSFDACKPLASGERYSFTFNKTGTFTYHNHVQASDTGTVVVR